MVRSFLLISLVTAITAFALGCAETPKIAAVTLGNGLNAETVSSQKIEIIVISGQSNAAGLGVSKDFDVDYQQTLVNDLPKVYSQVLYKAFQANKRIDNRLQILDWGDLRERAGARYGVEIEIAYGLSLLNTSYFNKGSATQLAIYKFAVGATGLLPSKADATEIPSPLVWSEDLNLADNFPSGRELFLIDLKASLAELKALYPSKDIEIKALVWIQGENDVVRQDLETLQDYTVELVEMMDYLKTGDAFISGVKEMANAIIVPIRLSEVQTKVSQSKKSDLTRRKKFVLFNENLLDLADSRDDYYTIPEMPNNPLFIRQDDIHYNARGLRFIGREVADLLVENNIVE